MKKMLADITVLTLEVFACSSPQKKANPVIDSIQFLWLSL